MLRTLSDNENHYSRPSAAERKILQEIRKEATTYKFIKKKMMAEFSGYENGKVFE